MAPRESNCVLCVGYITNPPLTRWVWYPEGECVPRVGYIITNPPLTRWVSTNRSLSDIVMRSLLNAISPSKVFTHFQHSKQTALHGNGLLKPRVFFKPIYE